MRYLYAFILTFVLAGLALAQNEQAPITEHPVAYKDWTYKNVSGGGETNLREFARSKKLVIVVYWAPWCPNWKHDIAFVQGLQEKYASAGLGIIGVGLYDPVSSMKNHVEQYKLSFPSVYETEKREARLTSNHYMLRTAVGDKRKWGTPMYVFLDSATLKPAGDALTDSTTMVTGELIKQDAEKFIRGKLGLDAASASILSRKPAIEECEPEKKVAELKKP
jgi:thiol-disulfide isomerase/thioredoxin